MRMPPPHPDSSPLPRSGIWAFGVGLVIALWILWRVLRPWWTPPPPQQPPPPQADGLRITMEAKGLDLNRATDLLVEVVIQIESQGDPTMVGSVGERGLMQIREGTWKEVTKRHFGQEISFDRAFEPELNRQVGRLYLGDLQAYLYQNQSQWNADLRSLLFASYNAGPERVRQSGFSIKALPKQVQSYATRGSALHDWYLKEDAKDLHELLKESASPHQPE